MSYNPNLSNFLSLAQRQMLANFKSINNSFFQNHVSLTANEDLGKHNALILRPQTTDPTTTVDQCAIYNKLVSTIPQLFFRPASNGTPIQMSNSNLNTIQTGSLPETQSSFLAGPFTIYVGYIRNCQDGQIVNLLPASTLKYVGLSTFINNITPNLATTAAATNINSNHFTVRFNTSQIITNPTIYYMAIGQ